MSLGSLGVFVALNLRVRRVIVNRLEVLGFDAVRGDTIVRVQTSRHIAHHVLDELGVVVRALRDIFLVGALEDAV